MPARSKQEQVFNGLIKGSGAENKPRLFFVLGGELRQSSPCHSANLSFARHHAKEPQATRNPLFLAPAKAEKLRTSPDRHGVSAGLTSVLLLLP